MQVNVRLDAVGLQEQLSSSLGVARGTARRVVHAEIDHGFSVVWLCLQRPVFPRRHSVNNQPKGIEASYVSVPGKHSQSLLKLAAQLQHGPEVVEGARLLCIHLQHPVVGLHGIIKLAQLLLRCSNGQVRFPDGCGGLVQGKCILAPLDALLQVTRAVLLCGHANVDLCLQNRAAHNDNSANGG